MSNEIFFVVMYILTILVAVGSCWLAYKIAKRWRAKHL
jgi:hypothetical protein